MLFNFFQTDEKEAYVLSLSGERYCVSLQNSSCGCGVWKDTLIPCSHALAFMGKIGLEVPLPSIYSSASYLKYYSKPIPAIDFHSLSKGICKVPKFQKKKGSTKEEENPKCWWRKYKTTSQMFQLQAIRPQQEEMCFNSSLNKLLNKH